MPDRVAVVSELGCEAALRPLGTKPGCGQRCSATAGSSSIRMLGFEVGDRTVDDRLQILEHGVDLGIEWTRAVAVAVAVAIPITLPVAVTIALRG